jgi:hypothetical protein
MNATLDASERASLQDVEDRLAQWQTSLEAAAEQGALDEDHLQRLMGTLHQLASAVNAGVAPPVDPDVANEIRDRLVRLLTLDVDGSARPLDLADRALMETEAIRHVVRDLLDGGTPLGMTTRQAVEQIEAWLPRLGVADLARLLAVDRRSIPRLRQTTAVPSRRLLMAWKLIALLRRSWTDEGVAAWFSRPRSALGGRIPLDVLDDVAYEQQLIGLARRGRTQRAS